MLKSFIVGPNYLPFQLKTTSDESKLKTIENVLSKIDVDRDGHVKVDDVMKVGSSILLLGHPWLYRDYIPRKLKLAKF